MDDRACLARFEVKSVAGGVPRDWDHTYDPLDRMVTATGVVPTGARAHSSKIPFGVVKSALQLGAPPPLGQQ